MSYSDVLEGLKERLDTLATLTNVLTYAPTSVHETPMVYMLYDRSEYSHNQPAKVSRYFINVRLVVRWQDNEQAELQVIPFIDSIPGAVLADPHLGGRIVGGMAMITDGEGGFATIAGVEYRVVDFTANVKVS